MKDMNNKEVVSWCFTALKSTTTHAYN